MSDINRIPPPVSRPAPSAQKSSPSSSGAPKFSVPQRQEGADASQGLDAALDLFVFQPIGQSGDSSQDSGGGSGGGSRKEPENKDETADDAPPQAVPGSAPVPVNTQRLPLERMQKASASEASAFVSSIGDALPDGAESGIFEVALPDGSSMGVAVNSRPDVVSYLINPLTPQLASDLRQQRMELEGRLARRISRNVRIAVL
jgi:hypothetical protein